MTSSFWVCLLICVISFLGACIDHGNAYHEYKASVGSERVWKWMKVFLVVWGIPVMSFLATILTGFESHSSDKSFREQVAIVSAATNRLAQANAKVKELEARADPMWQPISDV